jgi:hypothetical protein
MNEDKLKEVIKDFGKDFGYNEETIDELTNGKGDDEDGNIHE